MAYDAAFLGDDFSDWAQLTEEYAQGLEALRRCEPGASSRMREIARLMNKYAMVVGQQDIPPIRVREEPAHAANGPPHGWLARTMQLLPAGRLRTAFSS